MLQFVKLTPVSRTKTTDFTQIFYMFIVGYDLNDLNPNTGGWWWSWPSGEVEWAGESRSEMVIRRRLWSDFSLAGFLI